jgi:hypothetical protein
VYLNREGSFHGKCAYCEQPISANQYGDIDHFRPKSGVTNEDGTPVLVTTDGAIKAHPGYYWLAYSWRNLLPSCEICNRPSKHRSGEKTIGKRTQFPVRDFRAARPGEEEQEEPLLVHPVEDEPADHLRMDAQGILWHLTDRGEATIEILALNKRGLPNDRKQKYDSVISRMGLLFQLAAVDPNGATTAHLLSELIREKAGDSGYTIAARQAIEDAKSRIVPPGLAL